MSVVEIERPRRDVVVLRLNRPGHVLTLQRLRELGALPAPDTGGVR